MGVVALLFLCGGVNNPLLSPSPPAGRQVSLRLAEEAKKRERFEELKQHLEQEQEVVKVWKQLVRRVCREEKRGRYQLDTAFLLPEKVCEKILNKCDRVKKY